jgi:bifunctional UDP-N-acetylglucosamine pyrophosphorylase/glucosamine-1-phosphate N-acetyltransferase
MNNITVIISPEEEDEMRAAVEKANADVQVLAQVGNGQSGAIMTGIKNLDAGKDLLVINMNDLFDDSLFDELLERIPELRDQDRCLLTGYKVEEYFPGGYLVMDDEGYVVDVKEKPGTGNEPSDVVRLVVDYFRNTGELEEYILNAETEEDDEYEVALADMMNKGIKFELLAYGGRWSTLKYAWHVFAMQNHLLADIEGQQISEDAYVDENAVIQGDVIIEAGAKVFAGAVINGPVYIGENSIVGNGALVRDSIVGANSVIGFGSEVARSYIADHVWFHRNYVGDSIIDSNVSFGSDTQTANLRLDEDSVKVRVKGKKVDSGMDKLGAIIGPNVRVGVGTQIMPGMTIGENSVIGPALVLDQDVDPGKFVRTEQNLKISDNTLDIEGLIRD